MANYPAQLLQIEGTAIVPVSGHDVYRSTSGKPKVRTYYDVTRSNVVIKHYLDQTGVDDLDDFYEANKKKIFTFVYAADGLSHSCYFTNAPVVVPREGGYYDVTITAVVA
jgi:hypothetical protein